MSLNLIGMGETRGSHLPPMYSPVCASYPFSRASFSFSLSLSLSVYFSLFPYQNFKNVPAATLLVSIHHRISYFYISSPFLFALSIFSKINQRLYSIFRSILLHFRDIYLERINRALQFNKLFNN